MRPLVLEFSDDPQVVTCATNICLAAEIMVAPILDQGAVERTVYLPAGVWIDFWTDQVYAGPRFIRVPAPLETLPLFIRQGAIIPMGPNMQHSGGAAPGSADHRDLSRRRSRIYLVRRRRREHRLRSGPIRGDPLRSYGAGRRTAMFHRSGAGRFQRIPARSAPSCSTFISKAPCAK